MLQLLKSKRPGYDVHGLRSTFRDWAGEKGDAQLAEYALSRANRPACIPDSKTGVSGIT
jgi:hypothetical protein